MRPCALTVEPREEVREALGRMLTRCGFRVLEVRPQEFQDSPLAESVDVIFVGNAEAADFDKALLEAVHARYPHVPYVLVRRNANLGHLVEDTRAGCLDVLSVPLEPLRVELTAQRVHNCLAARRRLIAEVQTLETRSDEDHLRFRGFFESPTGDMRKLREIEDLAFVIALRQTGGNTTQAARMLGVARATFYRRMGSRMRAS